MADFWNMIVEALTALVYDLGEMIRDVFWWLFDVLLGGLVSLMSLVGADSWPTLTGALAGSDVPLYLMEVLSRSGILPAIGIYVAAGFPKFIINILPIPSRIG